MSQRDRASIAETADRYRSLVVIAFLQAIVGGLGRAFAALLKREGRDQAVLVVSLFSAGLALALAFYLAAQAHRIAMEMSLRNPGAWGTALFLGGIFGLLLFNSQARQWSDRFAIRFGLFGPNREDIERFART